MSMKDLGMNSSVSFLNGTYVMPNSQNPERIE